MNFVKCITSTVLLAMATLPTQAQSQTQTEQDNVTLTAVGEQGPFGYLSISVPLTITCTYNAIYIDVTTLCGQASYSLVLTARSSGRPLARLSYAVNASTGMCMVGLVQL